MITKLAFGVLVTLYLLTPYTPVKAVANGGMDCAVCTVFMAITEQYMEFHNASLAEALTSFCNFIPVEFTGSCADAVRWLTPMLIHLISQNEGPDVVCHTLKFCKTDSGHETCAAFTPPSQISSLEIEANKMRQYLIHRHAWREAPAKTKDGSASFCSIPGIHEICEWIFRIFHYREPIIDFDGDGFSTIFAARGSAWRGKDCLDLAKEIHPGALPIGKDIFFDSNCNGILGVNNLTEIPWEDELCDKTDSKGVAILGDSIGAHFHYPPQWLDVKQMTMKVFAHFQTIIENEIDWPSMSAGTGHGTNQWQEVISGPIDSIYMQMRKRNRCNHRDYQNIAINGATTFDADSIEVKSLSRNKTADKPLILFYALFGNDVCNSYRDTVKHMTTPQQLFNNTMSVMDQLHDILPPKSHVVMLSILDGRILFDTMKDRIHPLGSYWKNLTYAQVYDFINCLEISPCRGWMNSNHTIRELTAQRVVELNKILQQIGLKFKHRYPNFTIHYLKSPIERAIEFWNRRGGQTWQLIEPSDGFHCNQNGQAMFAGEVWQDLLKIPEIVGPVNPNNKMIHKIFGKQGGY